MFKDANIHTYSTVQYTYTVQYSKVVYCNEDAKKSLVLKYTYILYECMYGFMVHICTYCNITFILPKIGLSNKS